MSDMAQELLSKLVQHLNVRGLKPLDIPVVGPDDIEAVDVVGHPGPVTQCHKDRF